MRTRATLLLFALVCGFVLALSPAAGGADQTQIVLPNGSGGFTIEMLDGTVTGSVAFAPGTDVGTRNGRYSVAADDSIVYEDVSHGAAAVNNNFELDAGPVWLIGPGRAPLELDPSPYDFDAAISYSGSEVVFARLDPTTHSSDLYVINADGSGLTRITTGGGNNFLSSPKFSPDQGSVAYLCAAAGMPAGTGLGCGPTAAGTYQESGVMLMNADGSNQRMIVSGTAGAGENPIVNGAGENGVDAVDTLSWSPDGKWLAMPGCVQLVTDSNECESDQAFAYPTDGGDAFKVLDPGSQVTHEISDPGASLRPQFCGNSAQILFQKSWEPDGSGPFAYLIGLDGTNRQQITLWPGGGLPGYAQCVPPATGDGPPLTVNVAQPLPSPNGQVAVKSMIPQCSGFLVEKATDAFTTCLQGPPGFELAQDHWTYDVASNGSVVFTSSQVPGVWLSRPGEAPAEIVSSPDVSNPAISPDGSKVVFVRPDMTTAPYSADIYTVNADGSDLKLVAAGDGSQNLDWPTFSPDGRTIAYIWYFSGVMLMNVDGSNKRMIVGGSFAGGLSWSPDAKWLATDLRGQVYAYHTDGSDLFDAPDQSRQVTHETDQWGPWNPQFTSDGSQILYQRNVNDSGSVGDFWFVTGRDGTDRHEVFLSPDPWTCSAAGTCGGDLEWGVVVPPSTGGGPVAKPVDPKQATVPDVRALSLQSATKHLARVRLIGTVTQRSFSSDIERGHVLSQSPRAGAQASLKTKQGRLVKLVLSRGPRPKH